MRWSIVALLAACEASGSAAPDVGGIGAACAPEVGGCDTGLVCRDGSCRERVVEDAVREELPPLVSFDVLDASEPEVEDAAAPTEGEVADAADAAADVEVVIRMIGEHGAAEAPSETRLTLGLEQAAVQELEVPEGGPWKVTAMEVIALEAPGRSAGCGRFAARLWLPDELGAFGTSVGFQSQEMLIAAFSAPKRIDFSGGPTVRQGQVRAGIAYLGPCDGAGYSAWIALDGSGDVGGAFVFAGNWIPGDILGLPGRWAIRLEVIAGLP